MMDEANQDEHFVREPTVGYSGNGATPFAYEQLKCYHRARALRQRFYGLAAKLPDTERYGLANQIRRASLSVVLNLVEGSVHMSGKDQARFTEIAYGSLHESFAAILEAEAEGFVEPGTQETFRAEAHELNRMLSSYRAYQLKRKKS